MEEKEQGCECKAAMLVRMFQQSFYRISYTVHPAGIPGEAQGKSSNESWAAKQAHADYPEASLREKIIMTTMDGMFHSSLYGKLTLLIRCSGHAPFVSVLSRDCAYACRPPRDEKRHNVRAANSV